MNFLCYCTMNDDGRFLVHDIETGLVYPMSRSDMKDNLQMKTVCPVNICLDTHGDPVIAEDT